MKGLEGMKEGEEGKEKKIGKREENSEENGGEEKKRDRRREQQKTLDRAGKPMEGRGESEAE